MSYQIINVPIKEIKPANYNPRDINPEALKGLIESIKKFGMPQPLIINKKTNVLISGHQRLRAAQSLAFQTVPVVYVELSIPEEKALNVTLNNQKISGHFTHALGELLDEIRIELGDDFFRDIKLDEIEVPPLLEEEQEAANEKADSIPDVAQNECGVELGDIYQLGEHRLMCGDSTDFEAFKKLMANEIAELCFTSPPYADQREYGGDKELSTKHLATFMLVALDSVKYFAVNLGYSRKNGEVNPYWNDYIQTARDIGLKFLSWNVWDKGECGSIGNQTAMFGITHEWIFVFGQRAKDIIRTVKNKSAGERANHTGNRQADGSIKQSKERTVADFSQLKTVYACTAQKARDDINHPARFPVEFPEGYIYAMTKQSDGIYEPFCGSGSTLIACEKTNRKCFGMELDPHYCSVIIKRWEEFSGKQAVKL